MPENLIDPETGTILTPSYHGKDCAGNGYRLSDPYCCEECDYWQECFPDWHPGAIWDEDNERYI